MVTREKRKISDHFAKVAPSPCCLDGCGRQDPCAIRSGMMLMGGGTL